MLFKRFFIWGVVFVFGVLPSSDAHLFTAADGRKIEAKILSYDTTRKEIQLEKQNGRKVWVKPSVFCDEDQKYIHDWTVGQQFLMAGKFRVESSKKRSGDSEYIQYEIKLSNRLDFPLKDTLVEYRIYIEEKGYGGRSDNERCVGGKTVIPEILPNGKHTFLTEMEKLVEEVHISYVHSTDSYGNTTTDTERHRLRKDRASGIWLKIHGPKCGGASVVLDACYPAELKNKVVWAQDAMMCSKIRRPSKSEDENKSPFDPVKALAEQLQSYEKDPSASADREIVRLYIVYSKTRDIQKAEEWMSKRKTGPGCELLAHFFATHKETQFRDGEKAVFWGKIAVDKMKGESYALEARSLGTLACAYARNGQFDLAVQTQKKALKKAKGKGQKEQLEDHLELFKAGKAYPSD